MFGLYLVSALGSAVFYTGAGTLSSTVDIRVLQAGALGVRGVVMPLVAVAGAVVAASLLGVVVATVLFAVVGLTWAVIAVTARTVVARIVPEGLRGEALGVYAALSALAGGIGSIAGGALANRVGFTLAFVAAGVVILAGGGLVLALRDISEQTASVGEMSGEQRAS